MRAGRPDSCPFRYELGMCQQTTGKRPQYRIWRETRSEVLRLMHVGRLTDRHVAAINHVFLNRLKPTGHVMYQQFNVQQLYVLSTLYLCVLYLSENKQRLVPLTA